MKNTLLVIILLCLVGVAAVGLGGTKGVTDPKLTAYFTQPQSYQCGFGTLDLHCENAPSKLSKPSSKRQAVKSSPQSGHNYYTVAWNDAVEQGLDPTVFTRQINQESGFNPNAYSPAGAIGISQFMSSTASGMGIDPWEPYQSLKAAAKMDKGLLNTYQNYSMMLAAYNGGSGTLNSCLRSSNWFSCLPSETQNYIRKILG